MSVNTKRFFPPLRFRTQVLLLVGTLVAATLLVQGAYLNHRQSQIITEQIGMRAMSVAQTVAQIPAIIDAFDSADPAAIIQPLAEQIRIETGARYVVVGNRFGIRYAHPLPERLGLPMVGGDNDRALLGGEAYISEAEGSLGEAIRGKAPVFDANGDIIGIVSVGFMLEKVDIDIDNSLALGWGLIGLMVVLGLAGAGWLAQHLKKVILGLEPHEIARLVMEKDAILQSIHEGIVAVNQQGQITLLNQAARRFLGLPPHSNAVGRPVQELVPNSRLREVLSSGERQFDQEMWIGEHPVVVNRVPIIHGGRVQGAVATFRSRQEIRDLSLALNAVNRDRDALRVQAHEFSNKLYTISGLLQLDKPQQALALINQETAREQARLATVLEQVEDPLVGAILLGKLADAEQKGVQLEIVEDSALHTPLGPQGQEVLISVLGNLLNNAVDAALLGRQTPPRVRLFFTDLGEQLLFEVEDNGPGVDPALLAHIFREGFTTKPGKHMGIGLALVRQLCLEYGGDVSLEDGDLGGACFIVTLAKARMAGQEETLA
ncbi:histidine kinase [Zobellella endophytica]|uniref:histidine kinase n=1 Tax=Zobellella endophytica TaxID=2116700 RepID=A0A2P7RAM2_9GAMM|nr:sensor histidine kinase [Zobellella endophytica]PSJ47286.1 histidine kinase [Zobellella endophytica]